MNGVGRMDTRAPALALSYAAPMSAVHRLDGRPACVRAATSLGSLAALGLASLGCRATDSELPFTERGGWRTRVVYDGDLPLYAVAAGELDPATPGDELVAVGAEGELVYCARNGPGFESELIGDWGDGVTVELVQVAVGDVDRESPNAEIVVVGARVAELPDGRVNDDSAATAGTDGADEDDAAVEGVAWLLVRGAEGFTCTELHSAEAPLLAVLVADLDPAFPGDEVALAGEGREVVLLVRTAEGFVPQKIASLSGAVRAMAATRAGLAVACDDGSLVWLARPERPAGLADPSAHAVPWAAVQSWRAEGPLVSVAAHGGGVLVCGEDGVLRLFQTAGVGPDVAFVRETRGLTLAVPVVGVTSADVDPDGAGQEAAAVAADGSVHVVRLAPWPVADDVVPASAGFESPRVQADLVAKDVRPLRAIAAGRIPAFEQGGVGVTGELGARSGVLGLVCVGESGRILVVVHTTDAVEADGSR